MDGLHVENIKYIKIQGSMACMTHYGVENDTYEKKEIDLGEKLPLWRGASSYRLLG
jgi:hypothetical protein